MPAGADSFDREVDPQLQIRQFIGVVQRGWLTLLTSIGLGLLVGIAAYKFVPKSYTSTATAQLKPGMFFDPGEAKILDDVPFSSRRSQLEDQLRSTELIRNTLDKLEWPEWSRAKTNPENAHKFIERVKLHLNARVFSGELRERIVKISFSWADRDEAANFCDLIFKLWIDNSTTAYLEELNHRVSDAQRLLAQKKEHLDRARVDVEQFEMRNGISAINQHQNTQVRADQLSLELDQQAGEVANLQRQVDLYDRALEVKGPDGRPLLPPTLEGDLAMNGEKAALIARLAENYQALEARLLAHYTEKDSQVQYLEKEVADLLVEITKAPDKVEVGSAATPEPNPRYEEVKRQRDELNDQLQGLLAQNAVTEAKLKELATELKTLPQVLRQYAALRMDVVTLEQSVLEQNQAAQPLLDKKTLVDAKGPNAIRPYSNLETPFPSPTANSSIGWLVLAGSTLLGLAIAVAVVIGRELFRSSFAHAEQARQTLKLPVLGEVAPIQTAVEVRRSRFQRSLQVAASLLVLVGLAAAIVACIAYPQHLPASIVRWATDLRDALV
jgi:uncharacterized protein involved in exopolysaccharide biosynthesis